MAPRTKPIKHGTSTAYIRHKCRCDACRSAETERQRRWRARWIAGVAGSRSQNSTVVVPVSVRGTVYPSITAAARALGVMPSTISGHLSKHGHCDLVGVGYKGPNRNKGGHHSTPCLIHGRKFRSIKAAADYLGVGYPGLYKAMTRGMSPAVSDKLLVALMRADAAAAAARMAAE
ncbi:hypothetical protein LOS78_01735 [Paracoccus sp. MA]|uniref:NUMOD1 domain-containing DNA-binding protein n=1 Tax=Paracoccus sp. MA TaxID=2895796 RepID=UPI001E2B2092|nr:NUMOD1 domain-containing DNA-binding protein [Paracoccus sp. MA]UFM64220.1 hypothetical protein LOS78_01735 [Paracoccus sp. MA]